MPACGYDVYIDISLVSSASWTRTNINKKPVKKKATESMFNSQ